TIVTPFFNPGPAFHETARSVFQQSLQQWEWIIVNDGSTDVESLSILDSYRKNDPRIRVLDHSGNKGLSGARNTGFQAARAAVVVQLDSDDLLEPTAIEKWCWFLESYPEYAFVKGNTVQFGARDYLWQKGFHNGVEFLRENLVNPTAAIRRAVHQAVDGYDEADRGGLMDWDFWLRCAHRGYWGGHVPEFLDWYRRRPSHADLWPDFDNGVRQREYGEGLRRKYPALWNGGFPQIKPAPHLPDETPTEQIPCGNRIKKAKPRLLLLVPWMSLGGADRFNLDLLRELTGRGWEITVATTLGGDHSWLPNYALYTPDVFILNHLIRPRDYPLFLRYLMASRGVDVVVMAHSELGYQLLPYLRAHLPNVSFVDYCHIEEEHWKNGGYPRMAVEYQQLLDLNIVSSEHLKRWMIKNGAEADRISVCYTNVDEEEWQPDGAQSLTVRSELGLAASIPVILYAGRICEQKQPDVFGRTVLRLHEEGLPFMALVAGSGPDFDWLRSFVNTNRLDRCVRLLGEVSPARMKSIMRASDIFFLPSKWEGIALTLFEAMACGLPVVSSDTGGQRELVTPESGVLIARGDKQSEVQRYFEALSDLLRDLERRRGLGQAGRRRVSRAFRLKQMGERMVALLEQARQWHEERPRLQPPLGFGTACARQVVESIRLSQVTAQLWSQRNHNGSSWRQRTYLVLARLYEPWYRLAANRGWTGFLTFGERVKKALLRA
ncbi:MAG: glycosyltransferase, partial [Acidobacteria bacterium]